jgi:hypothetical protein
MQMNYFPASVRGGAAALPAPRQMAGAQRANRRAAAVTPAGALTRARGEAVRAQVWETGAWVALAAGSLAVLVMSLWL